MRHRKDYRKLGRNTSHRWAMLKNMATSLLQHERIRTTDEKAKEIRRVVERCITLARRARAFDGTADEKAVAAKSLHLRRQVLTIIRDKEVVSKLFDELATRFADRPGGYTRIVKIGSRLGDGAKMSMIELLPVEEAAEKKAKKSKAAPKKRTKKASEEPKPKTKKQAESAASKKDASTEKSEE